MTTRPARITLARACLVLRALWSLVLATLLVSVAPNGAAAQTLVENTARISYAIDGVPQGEFASNSAILSVAPGRPSVSGRIFDSANGALVDGATITLLDAVTGNPVVVYGADGVSVYPSSVISGGSVSDFGGQTYNFASGEYLFPSVPAGNYILRVTAPAGYAAPSLASAAALQVLAGAPYNLAGGFGEPFSVSGTVNTRVDVPLDPSAPVAPTAPVVGLELSKIASTTIAQTGDVVSYTLVLANISGGAASGLVLLDDLPKGFRFKAGSLRVNGVLATPLVGSAGDVLEIAVPDLATNGKATVSYALEVTVAAATGRAVNTAIAENGGGLISNVAEAVVRVEDAFMRDQTTIVGRVSAQACDPGKDWPREIVQGISVPNVRLYMEDGSVVITDADGQYHFRGVKPGVHVIQLDPMTLPVGYEAVNCEENTRFAGNPMSQMVDLHAGALWRADFYLRRKADARADAPAQGRAPAPVTTPRREPTTAEYVDIYGPEWLGTQPASLAWVYPRRPGGATEPSVRFGVRHAVGDRLTVLLNGEPVSNNHIAQTVRATNGTTAITHWRGVDIREGRNTFTVILRNAAGVQTARFDRTVTYASRVGSAEVVEGSSLLVADGWTRPEVVLRLTDGSGVPLSPGHRLDIDVDPPHRALAAVDRMDDRPVSETFAARTRVTLGDDGLVRVVLAPTSQTGAVNMRIRTLDSTGEPTEIPVRTWLQPGLREWILVGLAEGTVALNRARNGMDSEGGEDIAMDGRIAFFAQGTVRGDWLLTIAADTARNRDEAEDDLFRQIDPNATYTLYRDATDQQNAAPSRYPLYVKLERRNFSAMFGDFDTGMDQTELMRVTRPMSGLKTVYRDDRYDVVAFAADANQTYVLDELPSLGTSGPYRLSNAPLLRNSETVVVETRDRDRNNVVISTTPLVRHLDYTIDYETGTIYLRRPVAVMDTGFNPNILSISYESFNVDAGSIVYGGRSAITTADGRATIGASLLHEGAASQPSAVATDVYGVDGRVDLNETTVLTAEVAASESNDGSEGEAARVAVKHETVRTRVEAYYEVASEGFEGTELSQTDAGVERFGAEASHVVGENVLAEGDENETRINAEAYREVFLSTDQSRSVGEVSVSRRDTVKELRFGLRHTASEGAAGEDRELTQLVWGSRYNIPDTRVSVFSAAEWAIAGASGGDYDNRAQAGVDYRITEWLTGTVVTEYGRGQDFEINTVRAGLAMTPWDGGLVSADVIDHSVRGEDVDRVTAVFGVGQTIQLSSRASVSASVERQQLLSGARETGYVNAPFSEILESSDFTVAALGYGYREDEWAASGRVEYREDDAETRTGINGGITGDLSEDTSVAASLRASETVYSDLTPNLFTLNLSLAGAIRPLDRDAIYLNRLDLGLTEQGDVTTTKAVDNLSANYRLKERGQASVHFGAKYAQTSTGDGEFDGFSYFVGTEARYDITERFDIGLHGAIAQSLNSGLTDYAWGPEIGFSASNNAWISLGYNFEGLRDDDFGGAEFTTEGFYIRLRLKFDQVSVRSAANYLKVQ